MDLAGTARRAGALLAGGDTVERTAALVSASMAGTSFGPGLLPRPGRDQALATGIVAATQHGLVMTSQSACAAVARLIARDDGTSAGRARSFAAQAAVSGGLAGAGAVAERLLAARPGEPVRRAVLRTAGRRVSRIGLAAAALSAVAATDAAVGGRRPALRVIAAGGGLLAGAAFAGWQIHRYHADEQAQAARIPPLTDPLTGEAAAGKIAPPPPPLPPVARSLLMGAAVSAGLHGVAFAEGAFARGLAAGIRRVAPGAGPVAGMAGHAAGLGMTVGGLALAVEYIDRRAETGGSAIDAAYTSPPDAVTVSGGPASAVAWPSLSREGVRFVNLALTRQEIADVTGAPVDQVKAPVRAFAGLASGPTVDVRVDLVMEDLARLGAFDRSVLCVASPTGSGYVNYVAIETLEYLTRGDCATVALQYSLRPSFLSLDRVAMGREQNRALLHALEWRLRGLPEAPGPAWWASVSPSARTPCRTRSCTRACPGCTASGWTGRCSWAPRRKASGPNSGASTRNTPIRTLRSPRSPRIRSGLRSRPMTVPAAGTCCCPTMRTRLPGSSPPSPCNSPAGSARPPAGRPGCRP